MFSDFSHKFHAYPEDLTACGHILLLFKLMELLPLDAHMLHFS